MSLLAFLEDFWSTPSAFGLPLGVVLIIFWVVSQLKKGEVDQAEESGDPVQTRPRQPAQTKAKGPECPYCAGAIKGGVVKCRHCASDIMWCGVYGKSYPIKADANAEQFAAQKRQELDARKRAKEERLKERHKRNERRVQIEQIEALKPENPMPQIMAGIGSLLFVVLGLWLFFHTGDYGIFQKIAGIACILFFGGGALVLFKVTWDTLAENKDKAAEKARDKARDKAMAAVITVNCPLCAQEMHVRPFPNEQVIQCKHCSESFVVPAVITVNCPLCAQEMHVTPFPNEQVIQCKNWHCSESFVVPAVK